MQSSQHIDDTIHISESRGTKRPRSELSSSSDNIGGEDTSIGENSEDDLPELIKEIIEDLFGSRFDELVREWISQIGRPLFESRITEAFKELIATQSRTPTQMIQSREYIRDLSHFPAKGPVITGPPRRLL